MKGAEVARTVSVCGMLSVALLAWPLGEAAAQSELGQEAPIVRVGKRVQVSAATLFSFNREDAFCPFGSFVDATQFAVRVFDAGARRLTGFGVEVTHVADGQFPWPWASRASIAQDHDGGLLVTGNVYLSARRSQRVDVDLVAGAGIRRWNEGDGIAEFVSTPPNGVYRIQSQTNPILTYGVLVDLSLTDVLSLQGQARANSTFTGDLDVRGPAGELETVAAGTQTFMHLSAGLGVRVGGR